ncbi:hypothetical protein AXG93_285s1280 [Marchantia polymorpha subsp. ruderalis]|uniref:Uncharacterized protein n=1 Tax=Marchantia polymorpha subsp. ruderalis TaxID=1480154 RepID=A0A176VSZ0_MARPO|nr:hypothetical protein AXG93_285s1280 [Marchantia polymorpha subsp. ruderalis]
MRLPGGFIVTCTDAEYALPAGTQPSLRESIEAFVIFPDRKVKKLLMGFKDDGRATTTRTSIWGAPSGPACMALHQQRMNVDKGAGLCSVCGEVQLLSHLGRENEWTLKLRVIMTF